jgi:hypothetical protein
MPALTRRRDPESHQECWHVYHGDFRVGTIGERAGVPHDVDQWGWDVGFYPVDHRTGYDRSRDWRPSGIAATFEEARAAFEAAWHDYLPCCTEDDFAENRRYRALTAWRYRMHDTGTRLPTELPSGQSKCFCGAPLTIASVEGHLEQAHMDMA